MFKQILLRPYQLDAVCDAIDAMDMYGGNCSGIVVLPTGSGKSLVAAKIMLDCSLRLRQRIILLTHRKELIEQDEKAVKMLNPFVKTSVYCAGLNRKEVGGDISFASIASVYRKPEILRGYDAVLIDECHLIPKDANTMYGQVLNGPLASASRIGLSATPFRLDSGLLTEGDDALFNEIIIQVTARELIESGYLSPLVGIGADTGLIETNGVHKKMGEFVSSELEQAAMNEELIQGAAKEIVRLGSGRKSHLIFCVTVEHAKAVAAELVLIGWEAMAVWGDMPRLERDGAIGLLKSGSIRSLTNVDVLTTGVDIPSIDCISLLRPTMSKARHIQSLGRGMRLHDGKEDCLVLDFSGNCARHGDIDELGMNDFVDLKEEREEKDRERKAVATAGKYGHAITAACVDPMIGAEVKEKVVKRLSFYVAVTKKDPDMRSLVVTYHTDGGNVRKWLNVGNKKARYFAVKWFVIRGVPKDKIPWSAQKARWLAEKLARPISISTIMGSNGFEEILVEHFEPKDETVNEVID